MHLKQPCQSDLEAQVLLNIDNALVTWCVAGSLLYEYHKTTCLQVSIPL